MTTGLFLLTAGQEKDSGAGEKKGNRRGKGEEMLSKSKLDGSYVGIKGEMKAMMLNS